MDQSKAAVITPEGITDPVQVTKGLRQGDGLSAALFNIALEGVIRECNITGSLIQKSSQVVAYADDIAVIARDKNSLEDLVNKIDREAQRRGLEINQSKTKYMKISKKKKEGVMTHVQIGKYKLEEVQTFKYLGTIISNKNDRSIEIEQRIKSGHSAYYRYKEIMRSKRISNKTKIRVYKTAIRPTVLYAAETMSATKKDEEKLKVFERKIVRKIYGLKKINDEQYRRLTNQEITNILDGEDIVRELKSKRLRWFGHVNRKEDEAIIKKITKWKPQEDRSRGRPKARWEDQVLNDLKELGISDWNQKIRDRTGWRKIVDGIKTYNNT